MDKLIDQIKTIPGGFLGALGLISLFKGSLELQKDILYLVNTYVKITNPIVDYTFGYLFSLVKIDLSQFIKTYLSIGIIITIAFVKMIIFSGKNEEIKDYSRLELFFWTAMSLLLLVPFWPLQLLVYFMFIFATFFSDQFDFYDSELMGIKEMLPHFTNMIIFVLVILFLNYGLLFAGVN
ncbi:hypothetical protein Q669_29625 [Labrenzia sp. C1B10]|uniref:hypothetical protein n=1 Tax=unclassified Labrenzia TaxID=2648686 RepID=UPI0003B8493A|nr:MULTISPECIES: hypothetical protein [unclassified Labrenzia]ERP95731.1 hypothetical protein Q669_29625 [Labrenzia sp. C1B10]ERS05797.1 hypothetical protein Q675_29190 [Labrenzia sp. C1B70]